MMKTVIFLGVGLVGNTASLIFAFMAFFARHSLIKFEGFSLMMTLALFNYLAGTLVILLALGIWKKGIMLGKASIASGVENILLGILFVAILLQDVIRIPIVMFPFLTGYGLIQQGKRAIMLEEMKKGF